MERFEKRDLRQLINVEVKKATNLDDIKEKYKSKISNVTNAYIERKYVKYCFKHWTERCIKEIKETSSTIDIAAFKKMFSEIHSVQNLDQVPAPFNYNAHYNLLISNSNLISNLSAETENIMRWKSECLAALKIVNKNYIKDLNIIEACFELIMTIKKQDFRKLHLQELLSREKLTYHELYDVFKMSQCCQNSKLLIFKKSILQHADWNNELNLKTLLWDKIADFVEDAKIEKINFEGRTAFRVSAMNLVMSEVVPRLEKRFKSSDNISEVHFVSGCVVHADVSLTKEVWHGKNIVVYTRLLKVHDRIIWDVSGLDNMHTYKTAADTGRSGFGDDGEDGFAGESGGNILIEAISVDGVENLRVVSNGGAGSSGQDGGNGKNGINGYGIEPNSFKTLFPSTCNFKTSYKTIEDAFMDIDTSDYKRSWWLGQHVYLEGKAKGGFQAKYIAHSLHRSLVLCEGLPATPPGFGGQRGMGGQGGSGGEIVGIAGESQSGANGPDGDEGFNGIPGKCGWDIGHTDSFSGGMIYEGFDKNSKLILQHHKYYVKEGVWCERFKAYVSFQSTKISETNIVQFKKRCDHKFRYDRQPQAQSIRRKHISKEKIDEIYSKLIDHATGAMDDIRDGLKNIEQNLIFDNYQKSAEEKETTQEKKNTLSIVLNVYLKKITCSENIIKVDSNSACSYDTKLFEAFLSIDKDLNLQKFRFNEIDDVAKFITKNLNHHKKHRTHGRLGLLNDYIHGINAMSCENVFNLITKDYRRYDNKLLINCIQNYVLKNIDSHDENIEKHFKEYEDFLENKRREINYLLKSFVLELAKPNNKKIKRLLISGMYDSRKIREFEFELTKLNLELNVAYNKLTDCLKSEFLWNNACSDDYLLSQLKQEFLTKGIQSSSFREVLSYIYNCNIKCYIAKDGECRTISSHNPMAKHHVHLLYDDGKVCEMNVDVIYMQLYQERRTRAAKYKNILNKLFNANENEISDYIAKKLYTTRFNHKRIYQNKINDDIQKIISSCKGFNKNEILTQRLRKLSPTYIVDNPILYYLMKRFSCEQVKISFEELLYLINSVIFFFLDDEDSYFLINWIIVTHKQEEWLNQLLFLKLQNYFRSSLKVNIEEWNKLLSKCANRPLLLLFLVKLQESCISIGNVDEIFTYLAELPKISTTEFEVLGLSEWQHKVKEIAYKSMIKQRLNYAESSDIQIASITRYALSIHNNLGKSLTYKLIQILLDKKPEFSSLTNVLYWFQTVCEETCISETEINLLNDQNENVWIEILKEKYLKTSDDRSYEELVNIITSKNNGSTLKVMQTIQNWSDKEKHFTDFLKLDQWFQKSVKTDEEILFAVDRIIEREKKGIKLRDAQKLSVMILLKNSNIFAQISTGEGKSLIIVAFAIIKALRKEKVHIVTSSTVLARRDASENMSIFKAFGVNVGHNCDEKMDLRKQSHSKNMVIYGELSYFQRDYLLDKFYGENILGDTTFDNIIVDEVDCMLLDRGNNMLYLSHDIAGFDKLESVYIFIWKWINRPVTSESGFSEVFDEDKLERAVLSQIHNIIDMSDLKSIDNDLSENEIEKLWHELINNHILDSKGRVINKNLAANNIRNSLTDKFKIYSSRLTFLFKNCVEKPKEIFIPNYLIGFVELHLRNWIKNAITALFMQEFQNYIIDVDRSGTVSDRNPKVVILDTDTGTDQVNSQWDEALHQFLQLKHGCKLTMQSLKAVFISNVSYFNKYAQKYGVTGTLGSDQEMSLLSSVHEMKTVVIPTSKQKQFTPYEAIVCQNDDEWTKAIKQEALGIVAAGRSILIICETMKDVNYLEAVLKSAEHQEYEVVTYIREYEEFRIKDGLECGVIIISTNLAGRGTDIKLSERLCNQGGLHVCMTYLPSSLRVEEQGFGRAARRGERGSGRLIVKNDKVDDVTTLRELRDAAELRRISEVKSYYDNQIRTEEEYFGKFKEVYNKLKRKVEKVQFKKVLLDSCLDSWAIWLDSVSKYMRDIQEAQCRKHIETSFEYFLSVINTFSNDEPYIEWVRQNPMRMNKLGKCFVNEKKYDQALTLFNKVISKEPNFCEASYYYKALACKNKNDKEIALKKAYALFRMHMNQLLIYTNIVEQIKDTHHIDIVQIESFREQKKNLYDNYAEFMTSIDNILGVPITSSTFSGMNKISAEILYSKLSRKEHCLSNPKVNQNIDKKILENIAFRFGIQQEELYQLLLNKTFKSEEDFLEAFETNFTFCNKEIFWSELKTKGVLINEVKYVSFNADDVTKYLNYFNIPIKELNQKSSLTKLTNDFVIFNKEKLDHEILNNIVILKETDLISIIGQNNFKYIIERGLATRNASACINKNKLNNVNLVEFDSIIKEDLERANIPVVDVEQIFDYLINAGILGETSGEYRLLKEFVEIPDINLPFWNLYKETVMHILSECFAYRIALQYIQEKVRKQEQVIIFEFLPRSSRLLYKELVENGIIEPRFLSPDSKTLFQDVHDLIFTEDDLKDLINKDINKIVFDRIWSNLIHKNWIIENSNGKYKFNTTTNLPHLDLNINQQMIRIEFILLEQLSKDIEPILKDLEEKKTVHLKYLALKKLSGRNDEMDILKLNGLDDILVMNENDIFPWIFCIIGFGIIAIVIIAFLHFTHTSAIMGTLLDKAKAFVQGLLCSDKVIKLLNAANNYLSSYSKRDVSNDTKLKIKRVFTHIDKSEKIDKRVEVFLRKVNTRLLESVLMKCKIELDNDQSGLNCFYSANIFADDKITAKVKSVIDKIVLDVSQQIKEETKKSLKYDSYAERLHEFANNIMINNELLKDLWSSIHRLLTISNINTLDSNDCPNSDINKMIEIFLKKQLMTRITEEGRKVVKRVYYKRDLEMYRCLTELNMNGKIDDEDLKKKLYEKRKKDLEETTDIQLENALTKDYFRQLSKLLDRTRQIHLLAELLEENTPVSEIYLPVMTQVVPQVLGFKYLTIVCTTDDGDIIKSYTTPNFNSTSHISITISLVNNKFQLFDNGYIDEFKQFLKSPNNLYEALDGKHNCMLSEEKFGQRVAKYIKGNDNIKNVIMNIWKSIDGVSKKENKIVRKKGARKNFDYEIEEVESNLYSIIAQEVKNAKTDSQNVRSDNLLETMSNSSHSSFRSAQTTQSCRDLPGGLRDNDFLETVSNASYHSCEREQSVNSFDGQEINQLLEVGRSPEVVQTKNGRRHHYGGRRSKLNKDNNLENSKAIKKIDIDELLLNQRMKSSLEQFASMFYGLRDDECKDILLQLLKLQQIPTGETISDDWFQEFKLCHKLNLAGSSLLADNINMFFNKLENLIEKLSLTDGSRIFCLDETRFHYDKVNEQGSNVFTACCIVSADGKALAPTVVLPDTKLVKNLPTNNFWFTSSNGLPNFDLFTGIMNHFIKYSSSSNQNPSILIFDDHKCHMSVEALNLAQSSGVHILILSREMSSYMLPIKVGISDLVQYVYKEQYSKIRNIKKVMSGDDVLKIALDLFNKFFTEKMITNAFRICGIYPLDRIIVEEKCLR